MGALWGALLAGIAILLIWWQASAWYAAQLLAEQRAQTAVEVTLRSNVLSSLLNRRFARLQGLVAFVETSVQEEGSAEQALDEEFQRFAAALLAGTKGIRYIAIAPDGIVRYVYPPAAEALLGDEPPGDPGEEAAAGAPRTIESGELTLSGPFIATPSGLPASSGSADDGVEFVALQAVYEEGQLWGLLSLALDLPVLLQEAGLQQPDGEMVYGLRDARGQLFWGDETVLDSGPVISLIELPGQTWELAGAPAAGWPALLEPELTLFRAVGLLLALLLVSLVYLILSRQASLQAAVTERTRELAEANLLLEERVAARTRELEQLYREAQALAVLRERQRLARELHDSVSQALYGIGLGTRTAQTLLQRGEGEKAEEPLAYVTSLTAAALAEMRALIFELRPESLEQQGLMAALGQQAALLRARHGVEVVEVLCPEPALPLELKEVIYRVGQEAMHNVVKHAEAERVGLFVRCDQEELQLVVEDSGRGFDAQQSFPGHLGLRSMAERVEQVGGRLQVNSTPGRGTRVEAHFPLPRTAASAQTE